eukprot:SAG11_NODE_8466_length_1012_cov_0.763417_1_plen_57_part_10
MEACDGIILSTLSGGQIGDERPVVGLYGGSSHAVNIAPELCANGSVLVLFQAANVTH